MCKLSSGRKGNKAGIQGELSSALDFAKKDTGPKSHDSLQHDIETYLTNQEKQVGISSIDYEQFVYLIKRYSYKGTPLIEHMFKEISAEIGIDYESIGEEAADKHSPAFLTIKNREIF